MNLSDRVVVRRAFDAVYSFFHPGLTSVVPEVLPCNLVPKVIEQ